MAADHSDQLPQQAIYVDNPRADVEPHIPSTGIRSALDVGCGRGGFGKTLRRALGAEARLVGIEPVAAQAAIAREQSDFDEVVNGYFPQALADLEGPTTFDLITFNDVLEHLVDPWTTLRSTRRHLSPGGRVIAAIPSIQYAPVVWQLIRGRWDYADAGTLDRTHVRFFTRATMVEMFEDAGYRVESCVGTNSVRDVWATDPLAPRRGAKKLLAKALSDMAYLHFIVVASPIEGQASPTARNAPDHAPGRIE